MILSFTLPKSFDGSWPPYLEHHEGAPYLSLKLGAPFIRSFLETWSTSNARPIFPPNLEKGNKNPWPIGPGVSLNLDEVKDDDVREKSVHKNGPQHADL